MANANRNLETDFNVSPYYDDYDETKKFQRILFRPSFPVQARELTQIQTMLNEQIGRFGSSIYSDGTAVTGGSLSLEEATYLKLPNATGWNELNSLIVPKTLGSGYSINDELIITNGPDRVIVRLGLSGSYSFSLINNVVPFGFFGKIPTENFNVTSGASGAQFEVNVKISLNEDPSGDREERPVFHVHGFTTQTSTDSPVLYGEYLTGTQFAEGDELYVYDDVNGGYGTSLGILGTDFSGESLLASVSPGIFYTNNFFVLIDQQTTVISKYSSVASVRVGFNVIEDIVTEREDETLLDPAAGSPNENAPGAHRFKLSLQLTYKPISDTSTEVENRSNEGFYEIGRVINGEILDQRERPQYSVLGDELAKRMYDVNGNFVIDPFKISFEDKRLFTMTVISHTDGSVNLQIEANMDTLSTSDFIGKVFTEDERTYKIVNATKPPETSDSVFDIELGSIPDFINFQGQTIDVIDQDNFSLTFTSGEAYVAGRRFSTLSTARKDLEKTRTTRHLKEEVPKVTSVSFGNYLVLNNPSIALDVADFRVGAIFNLYSDYGSGSQIGTARVKQLKKGANNTLEMYYFAASFLNRTVTTADTSSAGDTTVLLNAADDGVVGATFKHFGTRYKIVSRDTNEITLNIPLVVNLGSGVDLTLNYNANAIKSVVVDPSSDAIAMTISSSVERDVDGDGYDETRVLEGENTRLVFPVSDFIAKDSTDRQYRYMKNEEIEFGGTNSPGISTVTLRGDEFLYSDTDEYYLQIKTVTSAGSTVSVGDVISTSNIEVTDINEISIQSEDNTYEGTALLAAPVVRFPASPLSTELIYGNTEETTSALLGVSAPGSYIDSDNGQVRMPSTTFTRPGVFHSIGLNSVLRIRGIYELDGSETISDFKANEVTSQYLVDLGQRDEVVDHTKIALRAGNALPSNDLLVIVDRLKTNTVPPGEETFYIFDSYNDLYYDLLPKIQASSDREYDLRKVVDFRPRANNIPDGSGTDLSTYTDADKDYSELVFLPHAGDTSTFRSKVSYYVGRKDKITITPDLEFKILTGNPAEEPEPPNHEDRSLSLYDISQKSYSTTQDDVDTLVYDNNRYTMNDISILEERLTDLEKTVQLDKVEKGILSSEIKDANNTNLFKTGVFVDSFSTMNNSEVSNPDYKASVDTNAGELRPSFDQYSFSVDYDENNVQSSASISEDNILFPQYDSEPVSFVEQVLATRTENVNPFAVMDWLGELKLNPPRDFWRDVVRKPDVVTDLGGSNRAWRELTRNASRTDWRGWETKWSGWWRRRRTRVGVRTTVQTRLERKSLGDSIVDQSVIPLMRSVPGGIRFRGLSLKPNTIVYPFFDDESIIDHIRPAVVFVADREDYSSLYQSVTVAKSTVTVNDESATITHKTKNLNSIFFHVTPDSRTSPIYDLVLSDDPDVVIATETVSLTNMIRQKIGTSFRLKTDSVGSVSGIFDVPEGTFKTGSRNFKILDSSNGEQSTSSTSADADFESSGLRQTVQENVVSTRVPTVRRTTVRQSRTSSVFRWRDPLAQTFLIDGKAYPEGMFLHSVDLWVTSRDASVPLTLQIRPVNNGYPDSQKIIPFGEVHLDPEDVTVAQSPDLSNYTRFIFSTPIFLQPGEYSFVVMANSVNYEIYTALMGENVLSENTGLPTGRVVNKQPFTGVMFKSQNASTWSAYQEEDIMFRLNRVNFQTGVYTAVLNATFDKSQLAALAPFKQEDDHFAYDASGNGSKFSYNLYRLNVPQIRDFDDVNDPVYEFKPFVLDESSGSISEGGFQTVEINETFFSDTTYMMRESQPNSYQVRVTFGTNSNVVAPFIDAEQMNVIFIQNIIDELELRPDNDITITVAGSGYDIGDTFNVVDVSTSGVLGQLQVAASGTGGSVTDLDLVSGQEPKYITGDITLEPLSSVTGSGLEIEAQSEIASNGGPADAKYISRRLSLKSGFESQDLKVTMNAYRPEDTAIYVYYKVRAAEDTDLFDNKPWNLMYELSNPNDFSIDTTDYVPLEFVTYKTLSDGSVDSTTKGGTFYTYETTSYESFNMYAIKVVMTSNVTYRTPIINSLGAIALISPIEPSE